MTVLRVDSSARLEGANSRIITDYLVQQLGQPVIERDLVTKPLPPITPQDLVAVHGSHEDGRASLLQHLAISDELISELKDGRKTIMTAGMSYQVSDFGDAAHRSSTATGAKLFVID